MTFSIVIWGGQFLTICLSHNSSPRPSPSIVGQDTLRTTCDSSMICPDEELVYEVRWWAIDLGQIRLKVNPSVWLNGSYYHSAAVYVDSYDGLPFIDLHVTERTEMDSAMFSRGFQSTEKKNGKWLVERSRYFDADQKLIIEKHWQDSLHSPPYPQATFDTLSIKQRRFCDGLSILFYARANIHHNLPLNVPTVVYGKVGRTSFISVDRQSALVIDAFRFPIRVAEVEGRADFEGLYSLSGNFRGWFTDDSAAVPVKAEMQVLIGSVNIELKKWNRPSWHVPFASK